MCNLGNSRQIKYWLLQVSCEVLADFSRPFDRASALSSPILDHCLRRSPFDVATRQLAHMIKA
jgi:hypothetical protein